MTAQVGDDRVTGQVAIAQAGKRARIHEVRLTPSDPPASPDALEAIARADQIVLAPGSLYTSIVAVLCVPEIRDVIAGAHRAGSCRSRTWQWKTKRRATTAPTT